MRASAGLRPAFTVGGFLRGVTATSAGNAWAVGVAGTGHPLTLHWDGKKWIGYTGSGRTLIIR